jgi:hypothetical protein
MASYGFRLFTVEIFNGRKQKAVNFNDCGGEHFADVAVRLLKNLAVETMVGSPKLEAPDDAETIIDGNAAGDGQPDQPAFRVAEDVNVTDRTVRGSVWMGRFGSHQRALGAGDASQDTDIRNKAASRSFRFILALPDDGTVGILAVEDISRLCPVSPMTQWLRWQSHADALKASTEGELPGTPWWRIRVRPLTDEEHLERMIQQGRVEKLELVKHSVSRARTRQSEEFRMSAPLVDNGKISQVSQLVKGWLRREGDLADNPDDQVTDGDAARQLAAIVGPELVNLGFDDGWVVVQDTFERTKKISPSRMSEIFTYEQAPDHRIDTPSFYAEVRKTALRLQRAHNVIIDWPPQ